MRFVRLLVGLALVLPAWVSTVVFFRLLVFSGNAVGFWVAFGGGVACWLVVFALLPRPMWLYVFGHELTHVVWSGVFGGRLRGFRVSSKGGHVVVTRSNALVSLAPYFFPFYAAVWVGVYALGHVIWDWSRFFPCLHLGLGVACGFHWTLTAEVLRTPQTDLAREGWVFSAVLIWLCHVAVLAIGLVAITGQPGFRVLGVWWLEEAIAMCRWVLRSWGRMGGGAWV